MTNAAVGVAMLTVVSLIPIAVDAHAPRFKPHIPADGILWEGRSLLAKWFAKSEKVSFVQVELTPGATRNFKRYVGRAPAVRKTVYIATTASKRDGYAVLIGTRMKIGVALNTQGVVTEVVVMTVQPADGEALEPRFLAQFKGTSINDHLRINHDLFQSATCGPACSNVATQVRAALSLVAAVRRSTSRDVTLP